MRVHDFYVIESEWDESSLLVGGFAAEWPRRLVTGTAFQRHPLMLTLIYIYNLYFARTRRNLGYHRMRNNFIIVWW